MLRHFLTSLIVVTASAASVSGGLLGLATQNTVFTAPETALNSAVPSHKGYALSLMTTDGSLISAVDLRITGQLHQRWQFDFDEEVVVPTPSSSNTSNGDSHLTPISGALFGVSPTEDNNLMGSPLLTTDARRYGYGTFIKGAWGIPAANQANQISLGYVVVPDGSPLLEVQGKVATSKGTFDFSNFFARLAIPIPLSIPNVGSGTELTFGYPTVGNYAALPISLVNSGSGTVNVSSISLGGPDAAFFTLTGTLPTTLEAYAPPQVFGIQPTFPPSALDRTYRAVVQVATDWGNLNLDVVVEVPEPSTLIISTLAIAGLTFRRLK